MTTLVMVCTGDKYPRKACTNIEYQLVNVGFEFDRTHVVTRGEGSVYDKLKIFEQCNKEDENYVYFDLRLSRSQQLFQHQQLFALYILYSSHPNHLVTLLIH